jgi:choice-of-anchor B domain-containing protein
MKKILFYSFLLASGTSFSQTYQSQNISLISVISPNTTTNTSVNKYSGCWGWYQASRNKEYAISGASNGTYFIDVTNPATPTVSAFVPAKSICTWREMKTYQHYCYIVSDVCQPNAFQIVDLQYLPDSVHVVHNSTSLFTLGHTIWIDNDKMYVASTRWTNSASPMTVWSLANPESPVLLRKVEQDISSITEVHDMFVRNDTAFISAAYSGLRVATFNSTANTFSLVGSYNGYTDAGYNHSSALTQDGKHLIFCDEVPASRPVHLVNVGNLGNIQEEKIWHPRPLTTPHNPFVIGNKWAVVSAYQDGLFIYDISNPTAVREAGYFDTFYQGGFNTGHDTIKANYGTSAYNGNWGAYPYLPSKVIIANDMENGVFLLDASAAYASTSGTLVTVRNQAMESADIRIYPNPSSGNVHVKLTSPVATTLLIRNLVGQVVYVKKYAGNIDDEINITPFASGTYILSVEGTRINKQLVISH